MEENFSKGFNYLNKRKYNKAIPIFKKLLKEGKEYKEIYLNLGTAYSAVGNDDKAVECYLKANDPKTPFTDNSFINTLYPQALNNIAMIADAKENPDTAIELYKTALAIDPLYSQAIWNLGNTLLRKLCSNMPVNAKEAWNMYEYRFKKQDSPTTIKNNKKDLLVWNGIDKVDSLVVLAEQGFGDQMMFGRYIELLKPFADKIYVQCNDRIQPLFLDYQTCKDPTETDATHGIPICSLAKIFHDQIPSGNWLRHKYVKKFFNGTIDIGVTWSGSTSHANNNNRSTTPTYFRSLAKYGNLYTLNPTEANTPGFTSLKSGGWQETLSELSKLDLVISVDTSIVHLCGSVGMPCWVLMPIREPDWRWGYSSMGFDNIWYPSVKVFRNPGSWHEIFKNVEKALEMYRNSLR